jgi:PKD repeat protein
MTLVGNPSGGGGGSAPTASFIWLPHLPQQGQPFSFIDTSSGSDPKTWIWSIGGNEFSNVQNPTYYSGSFGTISVTLQVTNQYGTNSVTNPVTIEPAG